MSQGHSMSRRAGLGETWLQSVGLLLPLSSDSMLTGSGGLCTECGPSTGRWGMAEEVGSGDGDRLSAP